ncbi:hypothetical protein C8F01DRAFT_757163 [Mycena amicta]|nr:hypothetical protein C8F01DRAFT_757163 [Mycena amicta]
MGCILNGDVVLNTAAYYQQCLREARTAGILDLTEEEIVAAVPTVDLSAFIVPLYFCLATSSMATMLVLSLRTCHLMSCMQIWVSMGTLHRCTCSTPFAQLDCLLWRLMTRVALTEISVTQCLDLFFDDPTEGPRRRNQSCPLGFHFPLCF